LTEHLSDRERFIACLGNQIARPGDAIVLMQGDGHHRVGRTMQLFDAGYAPNIILVGGADNRGYGSYPSRELLALLLDEGVPRESIVFEETGPHTWAEAMRAVEIALQHGWRKLLIVSSPHHIFRAYLTFVAALREQKAELMLYAAPASDLPWFTPTAWGIRVELLDQEFERIAEYGRKGHVAGFAEGLAHLRWQELTQA
jgi:uncharacterized SAM-binding protein YcdF (DUF218 family)